MAIDKDVEKRVIEILNWTRYPVTKHSLYNLLEIYLQNRTNTGQLLRWLQNNATRLEDSQGNPMLSRDKSHQFKRKKEEPKSSNLPKYDRVEVESRFIRFSAKPWEKDDEPPGENK